MIPKFNRDAPQDQQPEDDHQRQIETAEARTIKNGKSEIKRSPCSQQPDFVTVPYGADAAEYLSPLRIGACDYQVNDARTEIEAIQQDVRRKHRRDQAIPYRFHAGGSSAGRSGSLPFGGLG